MIPYNRELVKWLVFNQLESNRTNQVRAGTIVIHTDIVLDSDCDLITDIPYQFNHTFNPDPGLAYKNYDHKQVLNLLIKFSEMYKGQTSETTANSILSHIYSDPNMRVIPDLVENFMEVCYEKQYTGRDT